MGRILPSVPASGRYVHRVTVPFGHCDIAGIVYTPRFTDYCMEAAEQFLKQKLGLDWYAINLTGDFSNPVMHFEIDFHHPVRIGDALELGVSVVRVGRSSFCLRLAASVQAGNERLPAFTAKLVLAFVDLRSAASIPIPDNYLQPLQDLLTEEDSP